MPACWGHPLGERLQHCYATKRAPHFNIFVIEKFLLQVAKDNDMSDGRSLNETEKIMHL